jgi:hypothetical protein
VARNLQARRKLSELYKKGVEVRFGPDGGRIGPFEEPAAEDEVALYVAPPSPLQREQALRDAQAKRARALIATKREEESEEHLTSKAFLAEMSLPTLIDYVLIADQEERRAEAIRDVLARDEWKDISALQDALRQFDEDETDEDDPEYKAILERDEEYGRQVNERDLSLIEAARDALKLLSRDELERRALEKRSELVGSQAFMNEYERQMTYYSVREVGNDSLLFFESARDWADQDDLIQTTIKEALSMFINEGTEAKNSQGAVSGSDSSALPSEPVISEVSIPETANA